MALGYESGEYIGLIYEKNQRSKISWDYPFKYFEVWIPLNLPLLSRIWRANNWTHSKFSIPHSNYVPCFLLVGYSSTCFLLVDYLKYDVSSNQHYTSWRWLSRLLYVFMMVTVKLPSSLRIMQAARQSYACSWWGANLLSSVLIIAKCHHDMQC